MNDQAMIAFLPANGSWCKQDFPHMTLVYAGAIEGRDISEFNDMGKDAINAARVTGSFSLNSLGVEQFGNEPDVVDVITLYPSPQLLVARRMVQNWDQSEFTDFKPHVTIGPAGSAYAQQVPVNSDRYDYSSRQKDMLPSSIYFDRLAICWGEKRLIFDLGNFG